MKRDFDDRKILIGMIGGAALIVVTMITAIFLVSRRPVVVVVPGADNAGRSGVAGPADSAAAGSPSTTIAVPEGPPPEITVAKVAAAPAIEDPLDPAWDKFAAVEVDLQPQTVAEPMLASATVSKLRVQAVRDDNRYAWRLNWAKAQPADVSEIGRFSDAVAMQFPLVDGAPYTMGGPGMPVRMLHWKAVWQRDVDEGFQGLAALYPNTDVDLYWFAQGKRPHAASGSLDNPQAQQWMIAAQADNPMADTSREHPIEELTAHGFGSSAHVEGTSSRARGVWSDGQWYVVIDRPINANDPLIERFDSDPDKQMIAFAVWDGDNANRGGRKHITNWLPMRIAP